MLRGRVYCLSTHTPATPCINIITDIDDWIFFHFTQLEQNSLIKFYLKNVVLSVDEELLSVDDEGEGGQRVDGGTLDDVLATAGNSFGSSEQLKTIQFN